MHSHILLAVISVVNVSLNPCCNGRCTRTLKNGGKERKKDVLILVVMEDALALDGEEIKLFDDQSLNPCCNGRCTRTYKIFLLKKIARHVLILVVMEDALAQR